MLLNFLRRYFGFVIVLIGAWVIAVAPFGIGSDGIVRFHSLDTLLREGKLDQSKYSFYGPIAATPLWYLGEAIGDLAETVWTFNRIVFLATVVGLWFVLRPVLSREERVRFTALLFFGSMFPWHISGFYAEVFHTSLVGLGLALIVVKRGWWAILGGVLCAWGTANVPASAVGLAFAACVLCWQRRRFRYLLLPALAAALVLLENYVRRGNALGSGYEGEAGARTALPYSGLPGFSYPLFFGLISILFSFGKGLIFFTPGLFARYPSEAEEPRDADAQHVYQVWLAVVVGLVLVYARWWAWYGGGVWGPRFLLFASLPASLVLARWTTRAEYHSTWANLFVLLAVALSCWVGVNGIVYQGHGSEQFWKNEYELESFTWYVPECSVLWMPFVYPKSLTWEDYSRFVAFAVGFAYLAWPMVRVLTVRARHGCAMIWRILRTGSRWRF